MVIGETARQEGADSLQILCIHTGSGRQTEPMVENMLCCAVEVSGTIFEYRLQMHGLPGGTGLHIVSLEVEAQILPTKTTYQWIDQNGSEPVIGELIAARLVQELQTRDLAKTIQIKLMQCPLACHPLLQHFHLAQSYSGQDIAESIIVTHTTVLVMWRIVAGLGGIKAGFGNQLSIVTGQSASP